MVKLRPQGSAQRLIVGSEPFLILGGELGNSAASHPDALALIWPRLADLGMNTVLVPVYWELVEPDRGAFDFSLVDHLLRGARQHGLRLVLLWFGSFKNSMLCYAPLWIKTRPERFPRAELGSGERLEILSTFGVETREADARAFARLMRHLAQTDGAEETVLMVQVENEVGMLGAARDASPAANRAYAEPVPQRLVDHLLAERDSLAPELARAWQAAGSRESGSWAELFGASTFTEELFTAWHYAEYVDCVARAGQAEHRVPMFVNAALNAPGRAPGEYPSGGPLPHLWDAWRAGAPHVDFLAPDIYLPEFTRWCAAYHRPDNPLFVPEAGREPGVGLQALYAMAQEDAFGFSPFAVESLPEAEHAGLRSVYRILGDIAPLILERQGTGRMAGVLLDHESRHAERTFGDCRIKIAHDYTFAWSAGANTEPPWPRAGGLVISLGPDEYLIVGDGLIVTFEPADASRAHVGLGIVEEGHFAAGRWVPGRRLNGDETHQGRHVRLPAGQCTVERVLLYRASSSAAPTDAPREA